MNQPNRSQGRLYHQEPPLDTRRELSLPDTKHKFVRNRATGGILLLLVFGVYWIYGWAGQIPLIQVTTQPVNWTSQPIYGKLLALSGVFTVIGYGLLLSYYKQMSISALFLSLFVVSFTIIASPIISKFWFNVFISDFKGNTFSAVTTPDRFFKYSFGGINVNLDLYNLKVAMANSISQLVMLLGVFGRLNITQVVLNTLIYNVTWNLCHFLCALLQINGPDTRIFDDYQISNVYLFGACYSLLLLIFLKPPTKNIKADRYSSVLALLGTFFVFLSFCATSTLFPLKFTPGQGEYQRSYFWQEGFLNIFFALSGSVIFACVGSIGLTGKMDLKECIFGTITGGIIFGPVAGTAVNIGAAIAAGLFSGLISSAFYRLVLPKLNSKETRDSYGVTSTLLISFLATFLIAPIILIAYFNRDWILTTLEVSNLDKTGLPLINASIAGWVLAYVGISMGIALVSGAAAGALLYFFRGSAKGQNYDYFGLRYGLTPYSLESLQEDYPNATSYERVMHVLRNKQLDNSAVVSLVEVTEIKREGNGLASYCSQNLDVQLYGKIQQPQLKQLKEQIEGIIKGATVDKGEGSLPIRQAQEQDPSTRIRKRKFRAIYGLVKTRQLEDSLSSSSLVTLKVETTQRSVGGIEERRVAMRGTFEKNDQGVELLNAYQHSYEDLSLQTDIRA